MVDAAQLIQLLQNDDITSQLGANLGVSGDDAAKLVEGALPALLGGLVSQVNEKGPEGLLGALGQHDGSAFDQIGSLIGKGAGEADGLKILGHIFGQQQNNIVSQLAGAAKVDTGTAVKTMALLAPFVLGALGKANKNGGLNAGSLLGMLQGGAKLAGGRGGIAKTMLSGLGILAGAKGLIGLLDADKDGDVKDDIFAMIARFFRRLFGGK